MASRRPSYRQQRRQLWHEQAGRCWYCALRVPVEFATTDHIKPLSKGGSNRMKNLVMACPTCNARKGSNDPTHLKTASRLRWLRSQPIFEWSPGRFVPSPSPSKDQETK